jgi:hypothetical protein
MKITGEQIVSALADRLSDMGQRCHDSAIVALLATLNWQQVNQLTALGDVSQWRNERVNRAAAALATDHIGESNAMLAARANGGGKGAV